MPETIPKWRRFENLVAAIQRDLAPHGARVTQDERLVGRYSETQRQIDIAVRLPTEAGDLLLIIDAKDHSRPLDVKQVEEFLGMIDDVGANRGALVSPYGFTRAARRRALAAGVETLTAVDVQSADWPAFVAVPVVVNQLEPLFRFRLRSERLRGASVRAFLGRPLFTVDGQEIGSPIALAAELWEDDKIDVDVDGSAVQHLALHEEPAYLEHADGRYRVDVGVEVRVQKTTYFGNVPLTEMRGFILGDGKRLRTRQLTTDWIRFEEVERTWRRLGSLDEIRVRPLIVTTVLKVLADARNREDRPTRPFN